MAQHTVPAAETGNTIWYAQPAKEWMEALPIGNGRLSGMVYGGIDTERVALGEISMWSGQPAPQANNVCGRERLDEMRRCFFADDPEKGNELGEKYLRGTGEDFGTHLPLGDLVLTFDHPQGSATSYRRQLDMRRALATVDYTCAGVRFHRQYIADHPDNVMAIRLTATEPKAISLTLGFSLLREAKVRAEGCTVSFDGKVSFPKLGRGGVSFFGGARLVAEGGAVIAKDSTVEVTNADAVTIIIDVSTDYNDSLYRQTCTGRLDRAAAAGFEALLRNHEADYTPLFSRMDISLGSSNDSLKADCLPTDARLNRARHGLADPQLDALFFQYGRYMLIASSRPNGTPLCANLQGIWNDNMACNMPWTCDYHLDINIEQNYWAANRANLAECNYPLFGYIGFLADHGSATARQMYGCGGWVAHTVCNAWGYTSPGWGVGWGMNVTAGAWLATHLWSHWLYTRDHQYLKTVGYPLLKRTAQFFTDYMTTDPRTGWLVTGPSVSPENGYVSARGHHLSLSLMPTIDRAVVWYIYDACIRASEILGCDRSFRRRLQRDIRRLPPLRIGSDGQLREWLDDVRRSDPSHRHSSHLLTLFPLDEISFTRNPDLMAAARKSIEAQTASPDWEDTEWSTANMLCFYARLKEPQTAYHWLQSLFARFTRQNLMTVSPAGIAGAESDIFSFDANEAAVAGMCEMLLQSYDGCIDFLPALPAEWSCGHVSGICAEGGLVVDMRWADSKMTEATITATDDCTFQIKGRPGAVTMKRGESKYFTF